MIINFSLENWKSFRDKVTFSMAASKERQHGERISRVKKYTARILPFAAIYGGNASGKTNFFSALEFVQRFIAGGTQPDELIPVTPFLLNDQISKQPTRFWLDLLIDETVYAFSFAVSREEVLEEDLLIITSTGKERILYQRRNGKVEFPEPKNEKEHSFLQFVFDATRDNQLFLTSSVLQNVEKFRPVYNWFRYSLRLIRPDNPFLVDWRLLREEDPIHQKVQELLPQLDVGILRLDSKEIPRDNIGFSVQRKNNISNDFMDDMAIASRSPRTRPYRIIRKDGKSVAKKLVTRHLKEDGTEAVFEIYQESAGSQRILELLPSVVSLLSLESRHVLFIDEVDRSLHTLLTQQLLSIFLSRCSAETRSQLMFTTHDTELLNQSFLRRDEIWVAERESNEASSLTSFSEYDDVRNDKDIRKSYLQGRLGGIPLLQ